ncbi:hypothetical protein BYT27DRAFT_7180750 [Phlegmacium glaucopus]|nr:hypothetical protein BYT27DRAFT_7180750 [Phlegmacium glaucopus]
MLCTTAKRILNVFVPNQIGDLDRTRVNTRASTPGFEDLPTDEQQKDNLGANLREVQAPIAEAPIVSATKIGEERYSNLELHDMTDSSLSILGHTTSDTTPELNDDENDYSEDAEDEPSFVDPNPIVFSEDPMVRSNEMLDFANDLVDIALSDIARNEEILDEAQFEDLSQWKDRLDQTGEAQEILETDTPTERVLKSSTYLTAAGEFLRRVIIVVERAKSHNEVAVAARDLENIQLEDSESTDWQTDSDT